MDTNNNSITILYHGGCPDGFGGAYAGWKKFGDNAEYIPLKRGRPIPKGLDGKDIYFIDFCYSQDMMDEVKKIAKSIIVLDHHEGVRDVATSFSGVFDTSRSGATIAWSYFHPNTPTPKLLEYVEDGDLYRFALPNSREVLSYAYLSPFSDFEHWDMLVKEMEDPTERRRIVSTGEFFVQHHDSIIENRVHHAEIVHFEGYECYLADAFGEFISDTGHILATKKPPIALIISADALGIRVSLRSDGSVDVSKLAQKYGGNGHPASAGFRIPFGNAIPWKLIEVEDSPR